MKKKLALLLTLVMIISAVVVPTNLFAASTNQLSKVQYAHASGKVFYDAKAGSPVVTSNLLVRFDNNTNLCSVGDTFEVELTNAQFFFAAEKAADADDKFDYANTTLTLGGAASATATFNSGVTVAQAASSGSEFSFSSAVADYVISANSPDSTGYYHFIKLTHDKSTLADGSNNLTNPKDVGYTIDIDPVTRKTAIITVTDAPAVGTEAIVNIPLVVEITEDADASVRVNQTGSSRVTPGTYVFNFYGTGGTKTTVDKAFIGKDIIEVQTIYIKENKFGAIKPSVAATPVNRYFTLTAPDGYEFQSNTFKLSGYGFGNDLAKGMSITADWDDESDVRSDYYHKTLIVKLPASDAAGGTGTEKMTATTTIAGTLYINGLVLMPKNRNAYQNDLVIKVNGTSGKVTPSGAGAPEIDLAATTGAHRGAGVTAESVVIGSHVDWTIEMTAAEAKQIYSGFRQQIAANITFKELAARGWFAERDTTFTLTDKDGNLLKEAKISGVSIYSNSAVTEYAEKLKPANTKAATLESFLTNGGDADYVAITSGSGSGGRYYNTTKDLAGKYVNGQYTSVTVDPHEVTLFAYKVDNSNNKKAELTITFAISTEAGFDGDIYVTATGGAITQNDLAPVLIAHAKPVVTLETATTNVQIGYQTYKVADISITETAPAALKRNGVFDIKMTGAGLLRGDMGFKTLTKLSNISVSGGKMEVDFASGNNTFKVTRPSVDSVGTIKLSDLNLYITRNVPFGDYYFAVVNEEAAYTNNSGKFAQTPKATVDTFAICNNYDELARFDYFNVDGIGAKYVSVVTEGANPGVNNTVTITANSASVVVNGKEQTMDAPVVVVNNTMYVPLRFVCNALGVDNSKINWNNDTKIATIQVGNTFVGFKLDSSKKYINNIEIGDMLETGTGLPIKSFAQNGWTYIPFRELGNALGIQVGWNADAPTQATYNAQ